MGLGLRGALALAGAMSAADAGAQDVAVKPLVDVRLRYEGVDQDGLPRDADAVTARVRAGVSAETGRWSALVESESTLAIGTRYFDGLHGPADRPIVPDPRNVELNRAQFAYAVPGRGSLTMGRQRIDLADQRFVASSPIRQNEQTFDAVRAQWTPAPRLSADVTYAWSVRTIYGIDGRGARQQAISGDNLFALIGYKAPIGTLTGFAYVIDADEAAVQGFRLSSTTLGVRFAGGRDVARDWKLFYVASWATQRDHGRNPNRYRAEYWLAEGGMAHAHVTGTLGFEVLGADRGVALTSFQAPLGALFKFQGWADRFTTTPPDGVRDLYASAAVGALPGGISLQAAWHRFTSDRDVRRYGGEFDLMASAKVRHAILSVRYADYRARRFATDTRKLWLTAEWAL